MLSTVRAGRLRGDALGVMRRREMIELSTDDVQRTRDVLRRAFERQRLRDSRASSIVFAWLRTLNASREIRCAHRRLRPSYTARQRHAGLQGAFERRRARA